MWPTHGIGELSADFAPEGASSGAFGGSISPFNVGAASLPHRETDDVETTDCPEGSAADHEIGSGFGAEESPESRGVEAAPRESRGREGFCEGGR